LLRQLLVADIAVFVVAFVATWMLTPVAARIAQRRGFMAEPNERSVHTEAVPYGGGVAMFAGLLVAFAFAAALPPLADAMRGSTAALAVILAGGVILVIMTIDDIRELSPPAKIAGMVLAAGVLFMLGVTMTYFRVPFAGLILLSSDAAPLVTAIWVIMMCNAMNLVDGLDGLAAGIAVIAAIAMFVFAFRLQYLGILGLDSLGPVICVAVAGIGLGFLRWNFHPAKIFMGDAGAMLLGLLLAAATMLIGGRVDDPFSGQTFFFFAPLVIPLVVLGIPLADAAFSFVRRVVRRQSPSIADREHLHHRLIGLGHGQRRAVLMIYAWTIILSCVVLVPTYTNRGNAVVPFALAGLALLLYAIFHPGNPRRVRRPRGGKHVRARHPVSQPGPTAPASH
jgi:UDP-GlcNAc:undecaprenyl-phosphate GlcNAc-1-phosphate transferase